MLNKIFAAFFDLMPRFVVMNDALCKLVVILFAAVAMCFFPVLGYVLADDLWGGFLGLLVAALLFGRGDDFSMTDDISNGLY